jgi:hypothetical protein
MTRLRRFAVLVYLLAPPAAHAAPAPEANAVPAVRFEDATDRAGIRFRHGRANFHAKATNVMPWLTAGGAGVAVGDIDNDGLDDLYFTTSEENVPNALYRNLGGFRFEDVAVAAGVGHVNGDATGTSSFALFFDYDNDGWQDLLLLRFGKTALFHNTGKLAFKEVTHAAGVFRHMNALAAAAFDYDRDGDLDLYIAGYFPAKDLHRLEDSKVLFESWETARNGGENVLFRNNGDGTFTDVTEASATQDTGWGMAVGHGDFNNDGWEDFYVANDFGPDKVFRNLGDGTFRDVSRETIGVDTKKGMNAEVGDYNNDGWLDVYVTNMTEPYLHECNMLWKNNRDGTFTDVSEEEGACDTGWGWGAKFLDVDNDGHLDIYAANGFISAGEGDYMRDLLEFIFQEDVDLTDAKQWPNMADQSMAGNERNVLLLRVGQAFKPISKEAGVDSVLDGRGVAAADLDLDGRIDIVVTNVGEHPILYRNVSTTSNHWLALRLEGRGPKTARSAVGARVEITAGGLKQFRAVANGNGFEAQSPLTLHFGLGAAPRVERLSVRWPDGTLAEFGGLEADRVYLLREGGAPVVAPAPGGARAASRGRKSAAPPAVRQGQRRSSRGRAPEAAAGVVRASVRSAQAATAAGTAAVNARGPRFEDVSKSAGAAVRHHPPVFDQRLQHIMAMLAAGAAGGAVGDYNDDGWPDVFVNDARLGTENRLLRNNADGTFSDVALQAGLGGLNRDGQAASMGLFFDYDGDARSDLLVVRMGTPVLFHNNGDGTFTNVSARSGLDRYVNALSAVALDHDRDGDLDLYLGAYFQDVNMFALDRTNVLHESWETARNGGSNLFYRNDGNGHFTEATREVGLEDTGWTMALGVGDYDNDGWPDIYVANDYGPDRLFRNLGNGKFEDATARSIGSDTKKGMNAEFGDYDNDGDLDIYVTNVTEAFLRECNMLWQNNGDGTFTDVAVESGTCDTGWGWGGKFFDYDNDGDLDLYVADGFFTGKGDYLDVLLPALWEREGENPSDPAVWPPLNGMGIAGRERNVLFTNNGDRHFTREENSGAELLEDSRAILLGDFDNDGREDLFVTNQDADTRLLLNRTTPAGRWLKVSLRGRAPNTDAIGARLTLEAGGRSQIREVNAGNGFGGQSSLVQHFGLGAAQKVERLTVRWPDGSRQTWSALPVDATVRVAQGRETVERVEPKPRRPKPAAAGSLTAPRAPTRPGVSASRGPARALRPAVVHASRSRGSRQPGAGVRAVTRVVPLRRRAPESRPGARGGAIKPPSSSSPQAPSVAQTTATGATPPGPNAAFRDVTAAAGVGHMHHGPSVDERLRNLGPWFTALGAGGAVGDYNNDGLEDIYLTDSLRGYPNALYRNDGNLRFTDVAAQAGVANLNDEANFSLSALFFDCDNDGWKDLFVARFGKSKLLRNRHDGTFADISAGISMPAFRNPVAAVAIDYDRDGDLDLYLGAYFPDVDLTQVKTTKLLHDSWEAARNGGTNVMLRNDGKCGLTDVTSETGLADSGWTLAIGTADIDRDGWTDLYVANDFGPDKVYRNLGNGTFGDVTHRAIGVDTKKSMNAEFGDYDNDGWLDAYVTNITEPFLTECNMLWRNNADFTFTDVSEPTGTCDTDWGWGAKFIDFDNDGWLDLYVMNGFISGGKKDYIDILMPIMLDSEVDLSDTMSWPPLGAMSFSGYEKKRLFRNTGRHAFVDVAAEHGVDNDRDGRALLVADFDNDGAQDMFLVNSGQETILYHNVAGTKRSWIELRLEGTKSNRDALGTRVSFFTSQGLRYRETNAGNGFEGQSTGAVHAGLGDADVVDRVIVEWPSGAKQEFSAVKARTRYKLVEGGQLTPLTAAPARPAPRPAHKESGGRR